MFACVVSMLPRATVLTGAVGGKILHPIGTRHGAPCGVRTSDSRQTSLRSSPGRSARGRQVVCRSASPSLFGRVFACDRDVWRNRARCCPPWASQNTKVHLLDGDATRGYAATKVRRGSWVTLNLSTHRFVFEISLSAGRPGRLFLSDDRLAHDTAKWRPVGRFGPCFSLAPPISGRRETLRL